MIRLRSTSRLALLIALLAPLAARAQDAPVVSMESLLNLRFYSDRAAYLIEAIGVAFPPADGTQGKVTLSKGGAVVAESAVIVERYPQFPAFGSLRPAPGADGNFSAKGPGDYTMTVALGDKVIGAYSFSLSESKSGDPFNPGSAWHRKGPWSRTGLFRIAVERPMDPVRVGLWLNKLDLPGYKKGQQTQLRIELAKGGKEVAFVEAVASDEDWTYYNLGLEQGSRATHGPFTSATLLKSPGVYTLRVRAGSATAKEWKINVAGGQVTPIATNKLGYTGPDALVPQGLSLNTGTLTREQQFWLAPIK